MGITTDKVTQGPLAFAGGVTSAEGRASRDNHTQGDIAILWAADRIKALESRLKSVQEVYAGMEGFVCETAPEAYQNRIIEQMYKASIGGMDIPEGWHINYNPKPIPYPAHDFDFWHDDTDVEGNLCGTGASREDCLRQIAEMIEDVE